MAAPAEHDKLAEVVEAGTAIARGLDLDDTLRAVVEAAARVTGAAYGALGVLGPDRRISRFITTGLSDEERERARKSPDRPGHPRRADRRIAGRCDSSTSRTTRARSDSRPTTRRCAPSWAFPSRARGGLRQPLPDGGAATARSPTRTSASPCCSPAWPPWRSRTRASTRMRPRRRSRHSAPPMHAWRSTAAAAAVLHEHDLMEALRLVAREAVRLLRRAPRRRCRAGRVRRTDPLRDRRRRGRGDLRHLRGAARRFLRRIRAARGRRRSTSTAAMTARSAASRRPSGWPGTT